MDTVVVLGLDGFFRGDNWRRFFDSSRYGGFLKRWVSPTTIGFPTKNDHFGVFWGYNHFKGHPHFSKEKNSIFHGNSAIPWDSVMENSWMIVLEK